MSEHDNDTCPHLVRASLLEAENARLKTEVQHLMIFCNSTLIPSKELQAENARLKAEVERLRKAGDAMERSLAFEYPDSPKVKDWNAAKEGKPSV
jgi:hypothetical protein